VAVQALSFNKIAHPSRDIAELPWLYVGLFFLGFDARLLVMSHRTSTTYSFADANGEGGPPREKDVLCMSDSCMRYRSLLDAAGASFLRISLIMYKGIVLIATITAVFQAKASVMTNERSVRRLERCETQ
jgi:hypothetical protein